MNSRVTGGLLGLTLTSVVLVLALLVQVQTVPAMMHLSLASTVTDPFPLSSLLTARSQDSGVASIELGRLDPGIGLRVRPVAAGDTRVVILALDMIPLRTVTVRVRPERKVVVGGHAIGVMIGEAGVEVITFTGVTGDGTEHRSPGEEAGLRIGDRVVAVGDRKVESEEHLLTLGVLAGQSGGPVSLTVKRDDRTLTIDVVPQFCQRLGTYSLGVTVKGRTAGVGTLTFYDPLTMTYAALGHPVGEAPQGPSAGHIVRALVCGIQVGKRGQPGEKIGVFVEPRRQLGSVDDNSRFGVVGHLQERLDGEPMSVATISEVQVGPAEILTVIDGQQVERFDVEIIRVNQQGSPSERGLILRVVDEQLLSRTGGIVQGMSGSPIVQNGRLVGAVTHVFVNDPARGYGVYAEWMIDVCDQIAHDLAA